ncbi:uncharacterized protein LOC134231424 [Saccostrea cucullata]|uniref:uncharacterized protein LOC134231424 n=1 Tax=Saccostrea cuccullata TaxID=36930 RepID=UPI002ED10EFA
MCIIYSKSQLIFDSNENCYDFETRLMNLENDLRRLKEKQQERQSVAFTVTDSGNKYETITGENQPIILKNVRLNIGAGYNSTTGSFTAPVEGNYAFFISVQVFRGDVLHVVMTVNDKFALEAIAGVRHDPDDTIRYYTGGNIAIISLKKNDVVRIKSQQNYIFSKKNNTSIFWK